MASGPTIIEGKPLQKDWHVAVPAGCLTRSSAVSATLACFLLLASLAALHEVVQIRRASPQQANASRSIETIRRFYAGLNHYMETGDATSITQAVAPGALAYLPEQGAMGDDSQLVTWLLALRSTHPNLRFTVDRIEAGDDIAIASVHMSGPDGARSSSQEFFRVREGRIVQHWTTAPSSMLKHPLLLTPKQVDVTNDGHLAVAEVTFSPGEAGVHAVDGPALMVVQRGSLTLIGDGASQVIDISTGATTVPGPNEPGFAGPGQAILTVANQASVRNDGPDTAVALIAALVEDYPLNPVGYPSDRPLPPPTINHASLMRAPGTTTQGSASIRPLAFDDRSIPPGAWLLDVAWTLLGPGATVPPPVDGAWSLAHVISGAPHHLTSSQDTNSHTIVEPTLALELRLHPAPCKESRDPVSAVGGLLRCS